MSDTTETPIALALTANEWAVAFGPPRGGWEPDFPRLSLSAQLRSPEVTIHDATETATAVYAEQFAALVALANAALPDGDPRKITRADVEAATTMADVHGEDRDELGEGARACRALAAKLAALLPPEEPRTFIAGEDLRQGFVHFGPDGKVYQTRPPASEGA